MNEPSNCHYGTRVAPRDTVERKRDGVHDAPPSSDQVELARAAPGTDTEREKEAKENQAY